METGAIGKPDVIARGGMKGALDIERGIGAKHKPIGVHEKDIGIGNRRSYCPIDARGVGVGDAA